MYDNKGGAILNYHGGYRIRPDTTAVLGFDTIVRNCVFVENYAEEGGAVFTYHGGNPTFEDCEFIDNRARYGGALHIYESSQAKVSGSTFSGNSAGRNGNIISLVNSGTLHLSPDDSLTSTDEGIYVDSRSRIGE